MKRQTIETLISVYVPTYAPIILLLLLLFPVTLRPNAGHGLPIHEVSRSHTTTHHSRYDSSGRVISPSPRPLPDTQHSQQTSMHPVGFETTISACERPQTYALDHAATGNANICTNKWRKFILKLLRHTSVLIHHLQGVSKMCQLKLWVIKMVMYNAVMCYDKMLANVAAYVILQWII